jgi:hypothetical protein
MSQIYRKSLIACCTPPLSSDRPYQAACSRHSNRCRFTVLKRHSKINVCHRWKIRVFWERILRPFYDRVDGKGATMGTSLVPYEFKSEEQWESWHEVQAKEALFRYKRAHARYMWLPLFIPLFTSLLVVVVSGMYGSLGYDFAIMSFVFILFIGSMVYAVIGIFLGIRHRRSPALKQKLGEKYPLLMACMHCNKDIDLTRSWICTFCTKRYDHALWEHSGSPFMGCENHDCQPFSSTKKIAKNRKFSVAGLQCPHCSHHVIFNERLYHDHQCNQAPFRGVARFVGDESQPTFGKHEPEETPKKKAKYFGFV